MAFRKQSTASEVLDLQRRKIRTRFIIASHFFVDSSFSGWTSEESSIFSARHRTRIYLAASLFGTDLIRERRFKIR
jgi:hypothetical protein